MAEEILVKAGVSTSDLIDRIRDSSESLLFLLAEKEDISLFSRSSLKLMHQVALHAGKQLVLISEKESLRQLALLSGVAAALSHTSPIEEPLVLEEQETTKTMILPRIPRWRHWPYIRIGLVGIVVLSMFTSLLLLAPTDSITLVAQSSFVSRNYNLTLVPGGQGATAVVLTSSLSESFNSTGTQRIPSSPATGLVVFHNQCVSYDFVIASGQRLSAGKVVFATTQGGRVPSTQNLSLAVVALLPGSAGNIGARAITSINFGPQARPPVPTPNPSPSPDSSPQPSPGPIALGPSDPAVCLSVQNPSSMSGGADPQVHPQLLYADLDRARAQITQDLKANLDSSLSSQIPGTPGRGNTEYLPLSFQTDFGPGALTNSFLATASMTARSSYYSAIAVNGIFIKMFLADVPPNSMADPQTISVDSHLLSVNPDGSINFHATVAGLTAPRINVKSVRSSIAGHSTKTARVFLRSLPVASFTLTQWPFSWPWITPVGSHIKISFVW